MADQMHDAGLNDGLREDGPDSLGEPFEAVDGGDQDVIDAPDLEVVHHPQPELGAFGLLDPKPKGLLAAIRTDAEGEVDRLVAYRSFIPDLDPQGVEKDDRIGGFERPTLPFGDFLQHRLGDRADQVRRDVDAVNLHKMPLDLPNRQATGIHRHDLVVEAGKAALILGDQLRIEGSFPVARHRDLQLRRIGQNLLLRVAVAVIAAITAALAGFLSQMVIHLGVQHSFGQRLLQVVKQTVLAKYVLALRTSQQLVQNFLLDRHSRLLSSPSLWPRTQDS